MSTEKSSPIQVTVSLTDPDSSMGLFSCLAENATPEAEYRIESVSLGNEKTRTVVVDGISPKQLETIEVAVDRGYYQTPKNASLEELAEELGVSKSAVSQRLKRVERNLVQSLIEASR